MVFSFPSRMWLQPSISDWQWHQLDCGRIPFAMPIFTFHNLENPEVLQRFWSQLEWELAISPARDHWNTLGYIDESSRCATRHRTLYTFQIRYRDKLLTCDVHNTRFIEMVGANSHAVFMIVTRIPSDHDGLRCLLRITVSCRRSKPTFFTARVVFSELIISRFKFQA
jgi:hypothetical protein